MFNVFSHSLKSKLRQLMRKLILF